MRTHYRYLLLIPMLAVLGGTLRAQHTFSIVAVDPATGEVGSAGASCLSIDVALISDVHPGVGAIHTQAQYNAGNQDHGVDLMGRGLAAQVIVDSLVAGDVEGNSGIRQYGVVTLAGDQRSAAFTGANCMDYKGHATGATYSIQGNILLGRKIIDSMEARYLRSGGSLADRLMEALQGANVPGADTRCAPNASSQAAFLRVAKPGDDPEHLWLDLRVVMPNAQREPLDSLQKMFNQWKVGGVGTAHSVLEHTAVHPNPASSRLTVEAALAAPAPVAVSLYDLHGRAVRSMPARAMEAGTHAIELEIDALPSGTYYCRVSTEARAETMRVVIQR